MDDLVSDITPAIAFDGGDAGLVVDTKAIAEDAAPASTHCGNVNRTYSYDQLARVAEVWSAALAE